MKKVYYYEVEMGNGLVLKSNAFDSREDLEQFDFAPIGEQFCESLKEIRLMEKTIEKKVEKIVIKNCIGKKFVDFNDDGVVIVDGEIEVGAAE